MISRIAFWPAQPSTMRGGALGADAGHLAKPVRLLFDEIEHRLAECTHEGTGVDRPNAADHPRAQILLNSLERGRVVVTCVALNCSPCSRTLTHHPVADELAGADDGSVPDHRHEIALPAGFDPQHAEAVLGIVQRDALNQLGEGLGWCCRAAA
jgi:hypothetical protein